MKFCPVVPEICRGQVHGAWKERRITRTRTRIKRGSKLYFWRFKGGGGYYRILWET
jgi:hypothetical protein